MDGVETRTVPLVAQAPVERLGFGDIFGRLLKILAMNG